MRITRLLLFGVLCAGSYAAAQSSPLRVIVRRKLPDDLESSLKERLSAFLAAQASGNWEEVPELLGRYRLGSSEAYTVSYKRCIVERMQEVRLLNFDFSIDDLYITLPYEDMEPIGGMVNRFAAEQSSWYLTGTGRFQTSSESWLEQTRIIAYRDQGQWYFMPPQSRMQDRWEKAHYTDADFARDRKDEVEVQNNPASPVEITDVHAYMNREYPSLRDVTFKLRNKTSRKVRAVFVSIGGGEGGPIEPKGQLIVEHADFSAYVDFCEGMTKEKMFVEDVYFADDSKWELKPPAGQE